MLENAHPYEQFLQANLVSVSLFGPGEGVKPLKENFKEFFHHPEMTFSSAFLIHNSCYSTILRPQSEHIC